jgi:hypothetical protein
MRNTYPLGRVSPPIAMLVTAAALLLAGCSSFVLVPRAGAASTTVRYENDREVAVQQDQLSGVAMSGQATSSYLALHVAVMNKGLDPTNIIPEDIHVRVRDGGPWQDLKVYSASEFMQTARDRQSAAIGLQALAGVLAASQARRTVVTTYAVVSPPRYYYYPGNRYRRYFTVVTTTPDVVGSAVVLNETAEQIARSSERFDNYVDYLNATLLKKNTVNPGDSAEGDVMVEYARGREYEVTVPFGPQRHTFLFSRRDISGD